MEISKRRVIWASFAVVAALLVAMPAMAASNGGGGVSLPPLTIPGLSGTSTTTTAVPTTTTSSTTTSSTTTTSTTSTTTTSSTTTTTTPPAQPTCGGNQTVTDDGVTWTCTFDAEFDGTSFDPNQWTATTTEDSGYTAGDACYEDDPQNVSVGNGYLSLTVNKTSDFVCDSPSGDFVSSYTAGELTSYEKFSQTYGRVEIVAKVPATTVAGLQSSLWLYPESLSNDSEDGTTAEIDIAEWYSEYPGLAIPYLHYDASTTNSGSSGVNAITNNNCDIDQNAFNDYVLEWTPTTITIIYNGTTCLVDQWQPASPESAPEPFNQPFFLNLTAAVGTGSDADTGSTPFPDTTEIKYVRVWQGNFSTNSARSMVKH